MVLAVIPTWAAPAAQATRDAHRIAQALGAGDPGAYTVQAVAATIGWVTAGGPSPLTGRPASDVPAQLARGEMMLASAVSLGSTELPADVWAALGVAPARAVTGHVGWADGVGAALGWLIGVTERSPVPLPERGPDGRALDARALFEARMVRHRWAEPEQRAAAWSVAQHDAARYARLVVLADGIAV